MPQNGQTLLVPRAAKNRWEVGSHRLLSPEGLGLLSWSRRRGCCRCIGGGFLVVPRSRRLPRFRIGVLARLHHALIDRRRVLQVGASVLVGSLRYPDDIGNLRLAGALTDLDAARVDTLLLHQVGLRIDCALGCQVHRMTLLAGSDHWSLVASGVA